MAAEESGAGQVTELEGKHVGERRQMTLLFCDLVGSTELSTRLDPEDWTETIRAYQCAASEVVKRFEGYVGQFLGDGLLIYFGYPQAHEDDAERAVRAALGIVDAVRGLGRGLAVRVGVHSGPCVLSEIDGGRPEALVLGETPNVAARVQGVAAPDTVAITAATHRLVSGWFLVEEAGRHVLKGLPEPVEIFRVVQATVVRSRLAARSLRGLTPFVGREAESQVLVERWAQARSGEGQVALVMGEAGIGKSRLLLTLKQHLAGEPHTWIECAGSPYHQHTPFHAVVEMLQQGLAWRGDESEEERVHALEQNLTLSNVPLAEAVPLLAPLLGLPVPAQYPPLGLSPEAQRQRTFATLAAWLFGAARIQPIVLVFEDLHWVDPSTLELQGALAEQVATAPVLILYTARPEFRAPWPLLGHHTQLVLNRLSPRQVCEMVGHVAAERVLAPELIERLVARADGVPLFVEELTRAVLESAPGAAAAATVPATLAESLGARLDRLGTAREVAQMGAVLGREFSYALLHAVSPLDENELQAALHRLADAELVYPRGRPPEASYVFKHALVCEVAYESLLRRRRQELHGLVARVLEERFPEKAAGEPELVARHYERARLVDRALTYYQRAGDQAVLRSAHDEAVGHFGQAIRLLAELPPSAGQDAREVELLLALGSSLIAVRGYGHPEAEATYGRARELCEAVGDIGQLVFALVGLTIFYTVRAEFDRALPLAERVLACGAQTGDDSLLLQGHLQVAFPLCYRGRFAASLEHCDGVVALYDPARHHRLAFRYGTDQGVSAHSHAAWNLWFLGHPDRALARALEGVALARQLGHPFSLALALGFETMVHWLRRDAERQRERAAETIALCRTQGFPFWLSLARVQHGSALAAGGAGASMVGEVSDALGLLAAAGNQSNPAAALPHLAEAHRAVGEHVEALAIVDAALALCEQTGQHFWNALDLKGELLLESRLPGSEAEAEAVFRRALEIASTQQARSVELRAATNLARLWQHRGRSAEARALLAPIYGWFTEGFDTRDLVEARVLLETLSDVTMPAASAMRSRPASAARLAPQGR